MKTIMEIPIGKLVANPHRNIDEYELDEELVESLMTSMTATDVWLGFEARERDDGMYEIAFGHHRLEAAKRIGVQSVVVSVAKRSELDMLDMMIQENHARRDLPQMVILEEVSAAAAYWNELLRAHPDYDTAPDEIRRRVADRGHYLKAVQTGIGRPFLTTVLGGNISDKAIKNAIEMLQAIERESTGTQDQLDDELDELDGSVSDDEPEVDTGQPEDEPEEPLKEKPKKPPKKQTQKGALAAFTSQAHAKAFMDEMNDSDVRKVITVPEHESIAKQIVRELGQEMTVSTIKKKIRNMAADRISSRAKDDEERARKSHDYELKQIKEKTASISKQCKALSGSLSEYTNKLELLGVNERMNGVEVMELSNAIDDVVREIERVAFYVGYNQEEDSEDE